MSIFDLEKAGLRGVVRSALAGATDEELRELVELLSAGTDEDVAVARVQRQIARRAFQPREGPSIEESLRGNSNDNRA